ncbi:hypothetical protein K0M31_002481 [Melipona bicolor]|uniref:Uncharacterized protein n=1 Tax=Melipona bicolor TaxID=60889 RepID=A0AA40KYP2_9HYME|nr:hypothetical protein K0M31_002481 [Melipona bicolor]
MGQKVAKFRGWIAEEAGDPARITLGSQTSTDSLTRSPPVFHNLTARTNWLVKGCLRPKERTEEEYLWKLIRKYAEHVFLCSQPARNADPDDGWFQIVQTPLQLKPQTEPRLQGLRLGEARSVTVEEKQACTAPTAVERIVVQPSKG